MLVHADLAPLKACSPYFPLPRFHSDSLDYALFHLDRCGSLLVWKLKKEMRNTETLEV